MKQRYSEETIRRIEEFRKDAQLLNQRLAKDAEVLKKILDEQRKKENETV